MVRKFTTECLMALATNTSSLDLQHVHIKIRKHVNHVYVRIISMLHQNIELTLNQLLRVWNCKKLDHENKNVVSIHRSKYMSVIILGCLVRNILYLPLYLYFPPPLPPQTFKSLNLCHFGRSLSSTSKCVDNQTWYRI